MMCIAYVSWVHVLNGCLGVIEASQTRLQGRREGVDAFYLGDGYLRIHTPLHIMNSGAIWVYGIVQ